MLKNFVIAVVVSAAMIGTSWAFWQEPAPSRPNPNPGAGGGPGGFPTFVGPDRTVNLLKLPEVQTELKLDKDKAKKLDAIGEEILRERERLNAEYNGKLNELNKKAEGEALGLLSDAQRRRTEQLRIQQLDLRFLTSGEAAGKLGISQEQRAEIRKIQTERDPRFGPGRGGDRNANAPNPNTPAAERVRETAEEANKRIAETREKVLAVLTPEQKAKWSEMTGEPFKFPTPQWPTPRGTSTRSPEPAKPGAEKKDQ